MSKSEPPPAKKLTPVKRKKISGMKRVSAALKGMTVTEREDLKRALEANGPGTVLSKIVVFEDEEAQIAVRDEKGTWMVIFPSEKAFHQHLENSRETERRIARGRPNLRTF